MKEDEWCSSTDLASMLILLRARASERALRMFGVACCRRVWHLMDSRHRDVIDAAERLADGVLSKAEFETIMQPIVDLWVASSDAREDGWQVSHYMTAAVREMGTARGACFIASFIARGLARFAGAKESPERSATLQAERVAQCDILRDLFGNPFRPFRFDNVWLAEKGKPAVELARLIYRECRFELLPTLADVLERSGYQENAVLAHCRSSGSHVRGCWVLDALRGKETAVRTGLVTEADWRTYVDPAPFLHFLRDKGSDRQWRLFAVACCRRIDNLITDERSRRAVEVAARYANGTATEEELEAARTAAQEAQVEAKRAEFIAEAEANFCITPAYAAVCCRWFAASAARSAVCRDTRKSDAEPGSFEAEYWKASNQVAVAAVGMNELARFGIEQGDPRSQEARRAAETARNAELQAHCVLLRDLFADYFGPLGDKGDWLPCGFEVREERQTEQWCLLPLPRGNSIRENKQGHL